MTQTIDQGPEPGKAIHWSKRTRVHFDDDQIEELLSRLEEGEALSTICKDPRMPAYRTVYAWLEEGTGPDGFDAQFRAARARGLDKIADDCIAIADDGTNDVVINPETGMPSVNQEVIQRSKLRIDTRLRLLGKWNRSKYGEGVDITSGGEKLATMDDEAAARKLQEIMERAARRRDAEKGGEE